MPLVDALTSYLKAPARIPQNVAWQFPRTVAIDAVVFIVGTPRSGTTLLKSLLMAHSKFTGSQAETTGIFRWRNAFEPRYPDFPQELQTRMLQSSRDVIDFFVRYTGALRAREAASRFVDKLTGLDSHVLRLIQRHLPKAKFLYISRDPRDSFCSARKTGLIPQAASAARFARYFATNERMRWRYLGNRPECHHLRYEDLVAAPQVHMREVMTFLDEEFERSQIHQEVFGQVSRGLAASEIHHKLQHPITTQSVGRYQVQLSPRDMQIFERVAGKELRRLGY